MAPVLNYVRIAKQWADRKGQAAFAFIGLNIGAHPNLIRLFRPVELRCRMYMDLVAGSRGLFFFAGPPSSSVLWEAFGKSAKEIALLTPALFNPVEEVTVSLDSSDILCYVGEDRGKLIVIAVNPTEHVRKCVLRLRAPRPLADRAEVMFENRTLEIQDGALADRFEAYGVRVYAIAYN